MRFIQYGYKMEDGTLTADETESIYVKEIFELFLKYNSLKKVCECLNEQQVKYDGEKVGWNKKRLDGILSSKRYIGYDDYPQIINKELFDNIQKIRISKQFAKKPVSESSTILKEYVYCGNCGKKMYRHPKWDTREKWICNNGCKCKKYFDDKEILTSVKKILNNVKENEELFKAEDNSNRNIKTVEIVRYNNEINNEINREEPNYEIIKKLVIDKANSLFMVGKLDKNDVYTEELLKTIKEIDINNLEVKELQNLITKIYINTNGFVEVEFLNGIKITEVNYGIDCESNNEN